MRVKGVQKVLGYYKTEEGALNKREEINKLIRKGDFEALEEIINLPCESDYSSKNNELIYIHKTPTGYIFRIKNSKHSCCKKFKTLEEALAKRKEVLGF